jgi:hypothetical protein
MVLIRFDSCSRVPEIPHPAASPALATWIADNIEDRLTGGEDHASHGLGPCQGCHEKGRHL